MNIKPVVRRTVMLFVAFLFMSTSATAEIQVTFGVSDFTTSNNITGHISFSEVGSRVHSNFPGGARHIYTYYEALEFDGVWFSTLAQNENIPGIYTLNDVTTENDYRDSVYDSLNGNYLIAGLAPSGLGVHMDFTGLANPISAVGMAWGTVRADGAEPSPCCVTHSFLFTLANGQTERVELTPANGYLGLGRELLAGDYIGFSSTANIQSIAVIQRGHNPGVDNISFGTRGRVRSVRPVGVSVTPGSQVPSNRINVTDRTSSEKILADVKEPACEARDNAYEVADYADVARYIPRLPPAIKQYAKVVPDAIRASARLSNRTCTDPPRFDYTSKSIYSPTNFTTSFEEVYGAEYARLDRFFTAVAYADIAGGYAVDALERLQGALQDNNDAAIVLQVEESEKWLSETDFTLEYLSEQAGAINDYFTELGIVDVVDGDQSFFELNSRLAALFKSLQMQQIALNAGKTPVPMPLSPVNNADAASPSYEWTIADDEGIIDFLLFVFDRTEGRWVIKNRYAFDDVCRGGHCAVMPEHNLGFSASHLWKVRARSRAGWSDWSETVVFGVLPPHPDTPVGLNPATTVLNAAPEFEWRASDNQGIIDFLLFVFDRTEGRWVVKERYTADAICSGGLCSVTPAHNLGFSASHLWKVRARNRTGWSDWSDTVVFGYLPMQPAASVPLSPTASVSTASPQYQWSTSTDEGIIDFLLFVFDRTEERWVVKNRYAFSDICSGDICSVTPAHSLGLSAAHLWKVRARSLAGWSDWSELIRFERIE